MTKKSLLTEISLVNQIGS